jgi:hypothetical protein
VERSYWPETVAQVQGHVEGSTLKYRLWAGFSASPACARKVKVVYAAFGTTGCAPALILR